MALLINKDSDLLESTGCSYWRIADYRMYDLSSQGDILLFGYKDKETYDSMEDKLNKYLPRETVRISVKDYDFYFSRQALKGKDIFSVMYDYCKKRGSGFKKAEDI